MPSFAFHDAQLHARGKFGDASNERHRHYTLAQPPYPVAPSALGRRHIRQCAITHKCPLLGKKEKRDFFGLFFIFYFFKVRSTHIFGTLWTHVVKLSSFFCFAVVSRIRGRFYQEPLRGRAAGCAFENFRPRMRRKLRRLQIAVRECRRRRRRRVRCGGAIVRDPRALVFRTKLLVSKPVFFVSSAHKQQKTFKKNVNRPYHNIPTMATHEKPSTADSARHGDK